MESECSVAQCGCLYPRNPNVDCLCEHVLAVLGHSGARGASAEEAIAPGRTVATDNVDHAVRVAQRSHQLVEHVELAGIVVAHILRAMVAKEVIELLKRIGQVGVADPVHDVDVLTRMQVVQVKAVLGGGGGQVGRLRFRRSKARRVGGVQTGGYRVGAHAYRNGGDRD